MRNSTVKLEEGKKKENEKTLYVGVNAVVTNGTMMTALVAHIQNIMKWQLNVALNIANGLGLKCVGLKMCFMLFSPAINCR